MYSVALRDEIRTWVLIQGKSQRAAARHFGLSRNTVAKLLLEEPAPKERRYQRPAVRKTPVRDVALPHIEGWLKENEWLERWAPKQCWTAHRMWVELHKLGESRLAGGVCKRCVRSTRQKGASVWCDQGFCTTRSRSGSRVQSIPQGGGNHGRSNRPTIEQLPAGQPVGTGWLC